MNRSNRCVVIGGGAAGIFAALKAKEENPSLSVIVLEKSAVFLSKVRISGGGRCNVTHACFDPQKLIQNYPRGGKELLGPFHRFGPKDTVEWFESQGVSLKTEADGRMFPVSNRSQTIIDALLKDVQDKGVELRIRQHITTIEYSDEQFHVRLREGETLDCQFLILATGSSSEGHRYVQSLGHTLQPPVPSLFTFNVPTSPLSGLSGVAVEDVVVSLPEISMQQRGPLLITHFGFSGPAALKLSAWAARELHAKNYQTTIQINWAPHEDFKAYLKKHPAKTVGQLTPSYIPKNLWKTLLMPWIDKKVANLSTHALNDICQKLHKDSYAMDGKTTHKEEFVTCGGITLNEVDFRTMQSKRIPHLFFAGEVLNIDGVTGGFNFQNAWTTGFLAGSLGT